LWDEGIVPLLFLNPNVTRNLCGSFGVAKAITVREVAFHAFVKSMWRYCSTLWNFVWEPPPQIPGFHCYLQENNDALAKGPRHCITGRV